MQRESSRHHICVVTLCEPSETAYKLGYVLREPVHAGRMLFSSSIA